MRNPLLRTSMAVISLVMLCAVASFGRRTEPVDLVCRKGDHDKGDTGTDRCMADPGEARGHPCAIRFGAHLPPFGGDAIRC